MHDDKQHGHDDKQLVHNDKQHVQMTNSMHGDRCKLQNSACTGTAGLLLHEAASSIYTHILHDWHGIWRALCTGQCECHASLGMTDRLAPLCSDDKLAGHQVITKTTVHGFMLLSISCRWRSHSHARTVIATMHTWNEDADKTTPEVIQTWF